MRSENGENAAEDAEREQQFVRTEPRLDFAEF